MQYVHWDESPGAGEERIPYYAGDSFLWTIKDNSTFSEKCAEYFNLCTIIVMDAEVIWIIDIPDDYFGIKECFASHDYRGAIRLMEDSGLSPPDVQHYPQADINAVAEECDYSTTFIVEENLRPYFITADQDGFQEQHFHAPNNRYFVGNGTSPTTRRWNRTQNWSASSGGAGSAGVPDSESTVYFDANSGDCTVDLTTVTIVTLNTAGYSGKTLDTNGSTFKCTTSLSHTGATIRNAGVFEVDGNFTSSGTWTSVGGSIRIGATCTWNATLSTTNFRFGIPGATLTVTAGNNITVTTELYIAGTTASNAVLASGTPSSTYTFTSTGATVFFIINANITDMVSSPARNTLKSTLTRTTGLTNYATDYLSIGSGDWDDQTKWNDGASGFPETGDSWDIVTGHTISVKGTEACGQGAVGGVLRFNGQTNTVPAILSVDADAPLVVLSGGVVDTTGLGSTGYAQITGAEFKTVGTGDIQWGSDFRAGSMCICSRFTLDNGEKITLTADCDNDFGFTLANGSTFVDGGYTWDCMTGSCDFSGTYTATGTIRFLGDHRVSGAGCTFNNVVCGTSPGDTTYTTDQTIAGTMSIGAGDTVTLDCGSNSVTLNFTKTTANPTLTITDNDALRAVNTTSGNFAGITGNATKDVQVVTGTIDFDYEANYWKLGYTDIQVTQSTGAGTNAVTITQTAILTADAWTVASTDTHAVVTFTFTASGAIASAGTVSISAGGTINAQSNLTITAGTFGSNNAHTTTVAGNFDIQGGTFYQSTNWGTYSTTAGLILSGATKTINIAGTYSHSGEGKMSISGSYTMLSAISVGAVYIHTSASLNTGNFAFTALSNQTTARASGLMLWGTFTPGTSVLSITSPSSVSQLSMRINDGTFSAGSGAHTFSSLKFDGGTYTFTSDVTEVTGNSNQNLKIYKEGVTTINHGSGTLKLSGAGGTFSSSSTYTYALNIFEIAVGANTINTQLGPSTITVAGTYTLTSGIHSRVDGTTNHPITVTGTSSITGTLTPGTSTITTIGALTLNSGGTLGGATAWAWEARANITLASGSTFTAGTSTCTCTTNNIQISNLATGNFFNLTINDAGNTVRLESDLTVGGTLTATAGTFTTLDSDTTTSWNLTTTQALAIGAGTVNFNASTNISIASGNTATTTHNYGIALGNAPGGGVLNMGSATVVTGSIGDNVGQASTLRLTSGTLTINSSAVAYGISFGTRGGTLDYTTNPNGTVAFTYAGEGNLFNSSGSTRTFANITVTKGAGNVIRHYTGYGMAISCASFTLNSGTWNTSTAGGVSYDLTVAGATSITGTFTPNTSTVTLNGATTINSGGTLGGNTDYTLDINNTLNTSLGTLLAPTTVTGGRGLFFSGTTWNTPTTFTHNSGTVTFDGTAQGFTGNAEATDFYSVQIANSSTVSITSTAFMCDGNLTIGTGSNTPGLVPTTGSITVDGTTTINAGATLGASNTWDYTQIGALTCNGTLTAPTDAGWEARANIILNASTFTAGTGTCTCTTNSFYISNNSGENFNNLTINTAGTINIEDYNLTVGGELTVTAGTFTTLDSDAVTSRNLAIVGSVSVEGILVLNNSTVSITGLTTSVIGEIRNMTATTTVVTVSMGGTMTFSEGGSLDVTGSLIINGSFGSSVGYDLLVREYINLDSETFIAPTSTGSWESRNAIVMLAGSTFTAGTGTCTCTTNSFYISNDSGENFNNLTINASTKTINIEDYDLIVGGTLTVTAGIFTTVDTDTPPLLSRNLTVTGTTTIAGTLTLNASTVSLGVTAISDGGTIANMTAQTTISNTLTVGSTEVGAPGTYSVSATGLISVGSTLTVKATSTFGSNVNYTLTTTGWDLGGTFNAPTGATWTETSRILFGPTATFNADGGTCTFTTGADIMIDNRASGTFNNVIVNDPGNRVRLDTTGLTINGTLVITAGTFSTQQPVPGTDFYLTVVGTVSVTGILNLNGSDPVAIGATTVNNGGLVNAGLSVTTITGSLTIGGGLSGSLNGAGSLTVTNSVNVSANATLLSNPGLLLTIGGNDATAPNGEPFYVVGTFTEGTGTVTFTGSTTVSVADETYYNMIVNQSGTNFSMYGNTVCANNLTITAGKFIKTGFKLSVAGTMTVTDTLKDENQSWNQNWKIDGPTVVLGASGKMFLSCTIFTSCEFSGTNISLDRRAVILENCQLNNVRLCDGKPDEFTDNNYSVGRVGL